MQAHRSTLALVFAVGALAMAGYAQLRDRPEPGAADMRLERLEARIARMEAAGEGDVARPERGPALRGHAPVVPLPARPVLADGAEIARAATTTAPLGSLPEDAERIEELVEASVEKKAARLQAMSNKKPPIDQFADTLELTERQRFDVEQEVIRGQHDLYRLLETPTDDGSILLDDLVDVLAHNIVDPQQAGRTWAGFLGRLLSERVPGTGETYALSAEAVKATVREGLRRTLSEEQYATFAAWRLDPTEIQEIEGSPWKDLEGRVLGRADELRAERAVEGVE